MKKNENVKTKGSSDVSEIRVMKQNEEGMWKRKQN